MNSARALCFVLPLWLVVGVVHAQTAVIDRVAIVVGRRAVKLSDIERDLRSSQLLNHQNLDLSDAAKRKIADRVIEQELIRQEIQTGNWSKPSDADVEAFVAKIQKDRFGGSESAMTSALGSYGLTPEQFRKYVLWQLTVLRFIDERFRPGVLVTDEDVQAYFDQHRDELVKQHPGQTTLEQLAPVIREQLIGERVNQAFEEWLQQARRRARVQFIPAAFGGEIPASSPGVVEP